MCCCKKNQTGIFGSVFNLIFLVLAGFGAFYVWQNFFQDSPDAMENMEMLDFLPDQPEELEEEESDDDDEHQDLPFDIDQTN